MIAVTGKVVGLNVAIRFPEESADLVVDDKVAEAMRELMATWIPSDAFEVELDGGV